MRLLVPPLALLILATPSAGGTVLVPGDVPTIGGALAVAAAGDTVLVSAGTYAENLSMADGVVLRGADPVSRPVLDGSGTGVALSADGLATGTRVENFVFRAGAGSGLGGGVYLKDSPVAFLNCRFEGCSAQHGGGLGADASGFVLIDCDFEGNSATQTGGAISIVNASSPSIDGCRLADNDAVAGGAISVRNGATAGVSDCLFDGNRAPDGAGIWFDFFTGGLVVSCTFAFQDALGSAGSTLFLNPNATPFFSACILAFATAGTASFATAGANPTWDCIDSFDNAAGDALAGGTNLGTSFSLDPQFCDGTGGVFTLRETSPCLPGADCGLIGAFGSEPCVATSAGNELREATWGSLKYRYR